MPAMRGVAGVGGRGVKKDNEPTSPFGIDFTQPLASNIRHRVSSACKDREI